MIFNVWLAKFTVVCHGSWFSLMTTISLYNAPTLLLSLSLALLAINLNCLSIVIDILPPLLRRVYDVNGVFEPLIIFAIKFQSWSIGHFYKEEIQLYLYFSLLFFFPAPLPFILSSLESVSNDSFSFPIMFISPSTEISCWMFRQGNYEKGDDRLRWTWSAVNPDCGAILPTVAVTMAQWAADWIISPHLFPSMCIIVSFKISLSTNKPFAATVSKCPRHFSETKQTNLFYRCLYIYSMYVCMFVCMHVSVAFSYKYVSKVILHNLFFWQCKIYTWMRFSNGQILQ